MAATALPVMPWLARQARYRCHGYTSATSPDRPANLYVREDQILPRLAALAISQAGSSGWLRCTKQAIVQVTSPAQAAELIDQHRADDITAIYDLATRTLRTDIKDSLAVPIG
jgi:hypothetical protein